MERSWLDTIQLLGLDVVLGVALAVLVIDRVSPVVKRLRDALGRTRPGRRPPDPDTSQSPWGQQEWRPSH